MTPQHPVSGKASRALLGATLGFFFGAMSISLFGPTSGFLADVMELTPLQVGLLVSVPSLSGSLLRIPMGASVDVNGGKFSFMLLLCLTLLGLSGLSILFGTSYPHHLGNSYWLVLLLGCLSGCGIATFSVGVGQVSYWHPKPKQGMALGVFGGVGTMSAGVVALVLPFLLKSIGFVSSYYVLLSVMAVGTLVYYTLTSNAPYFQFLKQGMDERQARTAAQEHGQELYPTGNIKKSLAVSAKIYQTWILVSIYFTTFGGFIALTSWFPTFWSKGHGLEPIQAGMLTATFTIVAAFFRIPGGKLSDRYGGVLVSVLSLSVVAVAGVLMLILHHWIGLFVCSLAIAVSFGLNNAATMKLIPVYVSQSVGGASGWVGGLGAFGGFVFPPLMGHIAQSYPDNGYGLGFIIFSALAVTNLLTLYIGLVRKEK